MSNFVTLEEAAKKLGVSTNELIEMRSRGDIFGYRDGGSWKFKPEEIERVASELMGDALDEDPAGSSLLLAGSGMGNASAQSDADLDVDSDVALVADSSAGSDVRLVASKQGEDKKKEASSDVDSSDDAVDELVLADSDDDDDELALASEDGDDLLAAAGSDAASGVGSDLQLASGSDIGSDIPISGSDALEFSPSAEASHIISGSDLSLEGSVDGDLIKGDSDPAIDSGSLDLQGSDLELTDDGDLVLGGGSDLALGGDSGINLMSPADSGISLEDEPLDLAASGISGLDLAAEGSDVEGGSAAGSAVDFQQDEEFQLSPSGALEADEDSGSQVIELEDSSEFGDAAVAVPAEDGFDAFADVDGGGLDEAGDDALGAISPAPSAAMAVPEVPYNLFEVLGLLGILLLMCLGGILISDVVRNMWAWSGNESTLTSGFTEMLVSAVGGK